ncbi:MAG TPA: lytic transglycosylase domain-containing protein [Anaeromyxobacter sp.]|nr:lytic transglycosylase domain-containing protein [Anaeromyxobacter sp.]
MPRALIGLVLAGLLSSGRAAAADVYSYVDDDGVLHFSNAPTDARYRKVNRGSGGTGVYRTTPQARARPVAAPSAPSSRLTLEQWREHIRQAADKYKLPEALLLAVMAVESNFDHQALSEKGAVGLMQLMPGTAKEMYVSDAWDPAQNIDGGARYLRILANLYGGDMVQTLAAYNAGPEAVRRAGGAVPRIPETQEYVKKVVALYHSYKAGR